MSYQAPPTEHQQQNQRIEETRPMGSTPPQSQQPQEAPEPQVQSARPSLETASPDHSPKSPGENARLQCYSGLASSPSAIEKLRSTRIKRTRNPSSRLDTTDPSIMQSTRTHRSEFADVGNLSLIRPDIIDEVLASAQPKVPASKRFVVLPPLERKIRMDLINISDVVDEEIERTDNIVRRPKKFRPSNLDTL